MIRQDFHVHTTFSDGKNTMEEMVLSAIDKNMECIGFSDHSYTAFEPSYCMRKDQYQEYLAEGKRLREKYAGKIRILLGFEQDYYSDPDPARFDYVIGSVHFLRAGDEYVEIDWEPRILKEACKKYFGGDMYALTECYYETVSGIAEKTSCDLIGHFDLISKFLEKEALFDPENPRYVRAWKKALDRLLPYNIPFEINTGAISRGYRTTPYPAPAMIDYIKKRGGRLILSSDAHAASTIMYRFEDFEYLL